jgi:hypothetical protein
MQIDSKEFVLLTACAGVNMSPQREARIREGIEADIDWDGFLRLGDHHGVLPLVARTLRQPGVTLPVEIQQSLQWADEENVRRNLWFATELSRILKHFEQRNLKAIPYKGPSLAEVVYGDLALRSFNDLDFLISPGDFQEARQALSELGYDPSTQSPEAERYWLKKGYERSFDSKNGKNLLELQWALLPYFFAVDLRIEDLLSRSTSTEIAGKEIACLSPEDSLLVLSLHAAKHLWTRLIWVCDIAESIRTQAIDHVLVVMRAREVGILRMLGVSLWLAEQLLGAELSPVFREVLASDPEIDALGKIFWERLARGASYDFESPKYFLLVRKLREHRSDRWRYLWRLTWTPGVGDLATVSLPEVLFPLYRIVRLGRLVRKLTAI